MAKIRAWISGKLRSGKKKELVDRSPHVQDKTPQIYPPASVKVQVRSPGFPSTRNLSKESIPARLPIPDDPVSEVAHGHDGATSNRAQEAIRKCNNDVDRALAQAVHASDNGLVSDLLAMPRLATLKIGTYQDCLVYADYHSAATYKLLVTHACQDSEAYSYLLDLDLFTAITESRWSRLDYLLDRANQNNKELLLQSAVKFDRPKTARWLLQNGVRADSKYFNGEIRPILPVAVGTCGLEMIELLLDNGADIEATLVSHNLHGYNALLTAADRGFSNKLKFLLDSGANIEATDAFGRTPLHLAAKGNHIEAVRLLLSRGASHLAKSKTGKQPIHLAGDAGHARIFNMLREHTGLPAVAGSVHYPRSNKHNPTASQQATTSNNMYQGTLWPDQVKKDQKTGEKYILTAADPAYWN